jgi:hypothetical protein
LDFEYEGDASAPEYRVVDARLAFGEADVRDEGPPETSKCGHTCELSARGGRWDVLGWNAGNFWRRSAGNLFRGCLKLSKLPIRNAAHYPGLPRRERTWKICLRW